MTLPLSLTMSTGAVVTEPGLVSVEAIWVNVADPKLASVGWGPPSTVGSSSIDSAESPGPV